MAYETQSEEQFSDNSKQIKHKAGFKEAIKMRESQDLVVYSERFDDKSKNGDDCMSVS